MADNSPKFNVAIVGAGAVGLYLALKLSRLGHKVTVFEKNEGVGQKPCSALISERIKNFIPIKEDLIEKKVDSCLIHFPGKTIKLKFKPLHLLFNRNELDNYLLELAQGAGAEVIFNYLIPSVNGFICCKSAGQDDYLKDFDKIIGCDGAFSKVRQSLSLPNPHFRLGLQLFVSGPPMKDIVRSGCAETWPIKSGFFWKIPKSGTMEYGAIGPLKTLKTDFEKFCKEQKIKLDNQKIKSALIPQGLIVSNCPSVALCGDATGLTKPWSGGGIIWGFTAADMLVESFPDFGKYNQKPKRFFAPKILKGRFSARLIYFLGNSLPQILLGQMNRDNDFPFL